MSQADGPVVYMDAVITPNRSLSPSGLRLLLGVVAAYNLVLMTVLLAIGALPVPVFLGLDVVGLYVAFRISNRRAQRTERVHVTADRIEVRRGLAGQERMVWRSPTAFTQVSLERPGEHETQVRLSMSQRRISVGSALSPAERQGLADALQRAVCSARTQRWPG